MSVAKKILMGSGAVDDYEIDQSLMFATGDTAYLHRTPGSAGNRKTWTWSAWVKRGAVTTSAYQCLFMAYDNSSASNTTWTSIDFRSSSGSNIDCLQLGAWDQQWRVTNRVFRDPSAWYHIVVALDTTDSTAGDRVKVYVNGVEETSFATTNNPAEDADLGINAAQQHRIGAWNYSSGAYFDGYMAEVHFIDGTALTPTSFGETDSTTGQWIPKEAAGLTYGTNGFYCKFVSGALGTDSSGEGNNYTAVNLANDDTMKDTPTNNMSTWNPIDAASASSGVLSQGNLRITGQQNYLLRKATLYFGDTFISTGKWYWEVVETGGVYGSSFGVTNNFSQDGGEIVGEANKSFYSARNYKNYTATSSTSTGESYSAGNVLGIALDLDNDTIKYYVNNSLENTDSTISASNAMAPFTVSTAAGSGNEWPSSVINFGQNSSFNSLKTRANNADANGYGDFFYSPPSGYLCACSKNLPTPTIKKPTDHFNPIIYTGNGSTQSISGVGFQPDLVWIKNRAAADDHKLTDAVREATKEIESNTDAAGATNADGLTSFASDGFALGDDDEYNTNTETYVSWNWKAGGTPTADNSASAGATPTAGSVKIDGANLGSALAGSIAATRLSANTTSGFSIVTYAGGSGTVAHGLGVAPSIVMQKKHDATGDWMTYVDVVDGSADVMRLNTGATITAADPATNSTSTVFSSLVGGNNVIAYCFASVENYSKMGSYVGNGNADGVFVYTGFRPAMVIIRNVDADATWVILDNKRNAYNVANSRLYPSDADAESTSTNVLDFLSDGFKLRTSDGALNASSADHMYLCFAEFPFKYSNAR